MPPRICISLSRRPAVRRFSRFPDLNLQRIALGGVAGVAGAAIAARAGGEAAEQIYLSEELQIITRANGAGFHEVLLGVLGEACAHEKVHDVVDQGFCFS